MVTTCVISDNGWHPKWLWLIRDSHQRSRLTLSEFRFFQVFQVVSFLNKPWSLAFIGKHHTAIQSRHFTTVIFTSFILSLEITLTTKCKWVKLVMISNLQKIWVSIMYISGKKYIVEFDLFCGLSIHTFNDGQPQKNKCQYKSLNNYLFLMKRVATRLCKTETSKWCLLAAVNSIFNWSDLFATN